MSCSREKPNGRTKVTFVKDKVAEVIIVAAVIVAANTYIVLTMGEALKCFIYLNLFNIGSRRA